MSEKMDQECWKTQAIIEVNHTLGVMGKDQLGALGGVLEHVCIFQGLYREISQKGSKKGVKKGPLL